MNRPTRTESVPALFSLNWVIRPQLAHGGGALEEPGHPGVLGHVALDEQGAALGVEAGGQEVERRSRRCGGRSSSGSMSRVRAWRSTMQ